MAKELNQLLHAGSAWALVCTDALICINKLKHYNSLMKKGRQQPVFLKLWLTKFIFTTVM